MADSWSDSDKPLSFQSGYLRETVAALLCMNLAESRVLILRASTRTEVSKIAPDTVISDPRFTTSLAILNYPIKLI